ncbi:PREDICTED: mitogen-activated protein kinase kinase kinase NPK1-like [Nicotiana attenuata]|uniref:Mitogen-activated protein kinase kinase kinase npk1 n=1 Tax=Nicotiana attenuata TaxID=49451 RepID=A0A1J6K2L4_NICAT|nr:PREDICTED: mitogen-activated protein kinase kinase kinase NPK1-like [Nicotiana attenuata]OIT24282.1 mitogen-activated protein kinase kinase kinase npk1 [Nicotiana attenuata]
MAGISDPIMWTRGKTIGRGSFGIVTLATTANSSVDIPSSIAVKSALFSRSKSLQKEREFLHEFQDCDHVIRCFGADVTEEDGKILYNMLLEYASGGSLADRIGQNSGQGLQDFEVKQYAKSILLGLSNIHGRGFVHLDIKPDNILLVGTEKVAKIADFGFAKKVGVTSQKRKSGLKGTPMYMAPESVLDNEYGAEADIWAFGCTVFEMVTGKTVWDCSEVDDVVYLLCKIGMGTPDLQNERLSKEAKDFLKKCLVKEPKSRWTADMLLKHPFLSSDDSVVVGDQTRKKELSPLLFIEIARESDPLIDDFCSSKEMDKLKPMKLLNCRSNKRRKLLEGC